METKEEAADAEKGAEGKEIATSQTPDTPQSAVTRTSGTRHRAPSRPGAPSQAERQARLIGQLKAAEARARIRALRLRYQRIRANEINHLVASQPTATKAMRLEALLPTKPSSPEPPDPLDKLQRFRIEQILEDEQGLTTKRTI
ncbi:protein LKAAEAR1 isoform X2 [Lethenteron reissneri]|uniref:protein LKAAEAR1 isoform X2 n=1 Tax=Lethenteron reissneri TaxID=7753 RepID=UPI002AB74556|nr:protein LKAAEAR1 isoform X2 [Lethenteron reissneri]XP_061418594.1 protein LKAAEAR1 isoform X2 [Lethenteron reissneri]